MACGLRGPALAGGPNCKGANGPRWVFLERPKEARLASGQRSLSLGLSPTRQRTGHTTRATAASRGTRGKQRERGWPSRAWARLLGAQSAQRTAAAVPGSDAHAPGTSRIRNDPHGSPKPFPRRLPGRPTAPGSRRVRGAPRPAARPQDSGSAQLDVTLLHTLNARVMGTRGHGDTGHPTTALHTQTSCPCALHGEKPRVLAASLKVTWTQPRAHQPLHAHTNPRSRTDR